ncbi:MAG: ImuA family protein [Maioricimonas sp. JB045]|uniref:ImuA family protein n=1 Tax=Maioricimonas sp. JC845 TaxID=3232138 RepID=UPI003457FD8F
MPQYHDGSRADTLRQLASRLRQLQAGRGTTAHRTGREIISSGMPDLDRLLPDGGFRRGTLVEWLADGPGTGVERLLLQVVPPALQEGGVCLVIDPRQEFSPALAAAMNIDLQRTLLVRPGRAEDAVWAAEQSLRCPGVAVTIAWSELLDRSAENRILRRLQLAAETGGGLGVLLRPASLQGQPSWADIRLLVRPVPPGARGAPPAAPVHSLHKETDVAPEGVRHWMELDILHCRGGLGSRAAFLEIDDETGAVHLVSELADSTSSPRATGA